ncbi:MAG: metalloregulator ArsR/SmtB family transcription factor [Deferrisomatales bacterium]|nr:metalloregulator ArsR/SmtB family transcription factor [Deferrisomatales bacterium]
MDASAEPRRAEILKAIAHPTRIAILELLRRGEECVCRICPELEGSQPNTSKHLATMKAAGILESRQEGTMTFYRVVDTRVYEILELVDEMVRREHRARMRAVG